MDTSHYQTFIKQYSKYRFIDTYTYVDMCMILLGRKQNPFANPDSSYSRLIREGSNAYYKSSWSEIQEANDLYSVFQNKDLLADLQAFLDANPLLFAQAASTVKEESVDWVKDTLKEVQQTPSQPSKKPQKPGPCPWVLQKGAPYPRECWNHRYYDPLIGKQLEENSVLLKETDEKKFQASLHHIRRYLEASHKQKPEVCPWIHPDSPQWNAEWSVTHQWETLEEQADKWAIYYTEPTKYVPPAKPTPLDSHYGTEVHSYRIGEGTDYRNVVDGYKRDLLSAIQIARQPFKKPVAPRYPPLPPFFQRV
jgi:hypothetical protein